jgi:hypothetical protein
MKKQDRRPDECQRDLGLFRKPDPGRDRNTPCQHTGHPHLANPEVMPLIGIVQSLFIRKRCVIKESGMLGKEACYGITVPKGAYRFRNKQ